MITVDTSEPQAAVRQLEAKGKNVSRLMPVIAEMLVAGVNDVYEAEGPGWPDLAESTKLSRRGSSYKILRDTGLMSNTQAGNGADWAEAYSPAPYADFHVRGNEHLPIRDPFQLGQVMNDVIDDVEDLVLREITT